MIRKALAETIFLHCYHRKVLGSIDIHYLSEAPRTITKN